MSIQWPCRSGTVITGIIAPDTKFEPRRIIKGSEDDLFGGEGDVLMILHAKDLIS